MRGEHFISWLDKLFFIKKGYSLWKHLIPFSVAVLLLLILSLQSDNLLLKLVKSLHPSSPTWLLALLLTGLCIIIYFRTILSQIQQAYLKPQGEVRRAFITFFIYTLLCSLLALTVLWSARCPKAFFLYEEPCWALGFTHVWACFLIAILSLVGVGWPVVGAWVDSIGIKMPDYRLARATAATLGDMLKQLHEQRGVGTSEKVDTFANEANILLSEIKKNVHLEPQRLRGTLEGIADHLENLTRQIDKYKKYGNTRWKDFYEQFPMICRFERKQKYQIFSEHLCELCHFWHDWNPSREKEPTPWRK